MGIKATHSSIPFFLISGLQRGWGVGELWLLCKLDTDTDIDSIRFDADTHTQRRGEKGGVV